MSLNEVFFVLGFVGFFVALLLLLWNTLSGGRGFVRDGGDQKVLGLSNFKWVVLCFVGGLVFWFVGFVGFAGWQDVNCETVTVGNVYNETQGLETFSTPPWKERWNVSGYEVYEVERVCYQGENVNEVVVYVSLWRGMGVGLGVLTLFFIVSLFFLFRDIGRGGIEGYRSNGRR